MSKHSRFRPASCRPHVAPMLVACLLTLVASAQSAAAQQPSRADSIASSQSTVITNATVVDVASGRLLPGMNIVVTGNRIVRVDRTRMAFPPNATMVDGAGAYVIPGLWDFHVHSAYPFLDKQLMPLYIANGVTGVREMFGDVRVIKATRAANADRSATVPRIVGAGHIVDGANPIWPTSVRLSDPARAAAIVDSLATAGANFIKVYSLLTRDAFLAVARAAKARGIRFAGHVPEALSIREASAAGMWTMEHLNGVTTACSNAEPTLRAALDTSIGSLAALQRARAEVGELSITSFDMPKCKALFRELARNKSAQVPTLTVLRGITFMNDSTLRKDPRLRYMPRYLMATWDPATDPRFRSRTEADWERARRTYRLQLSLIAPMAAAGVPMLAGTDVLNPYVIPGFSLHDELQLFVENGLSPLAALRAATLEPARQLAATDTMGTIAKGHVADLVLLNANPLADIRNTTKIRAVIANGRLYTRAALDSILVTAEKVANPG